MGGGDILDLDDLVVFSSCIIIMTGHVQVSSFYCMHKKLDLRASNVGSQHRPRRVLRRID